MKNTPIRRMDKVCQELAANRHDQAKIEKPFGIETTYSDGGCELLRTRYTTHLEAAAAAALHQQYDPDKKTYVVKDLRSKGV